MNKQYRKAENINERKILLTVCWWNNPYWGYGWQGGFQFVDLDRDGVFEYRYFLQASADGNTENAGYLYQPGMEISDLIKKDSSYFSQQSALWTDRCFV
ncbi:MAG: hypothetical protein MR523_04485 [Lachnospiraceae bacterium]|nr:hypothetical protein [Lachnospiraceae bacterium]